MRRLALELHFPVPWFVNTLGVPGGVCKMSIVPPAVLNIQISVARGSSVRVQEKEVLVFHRWNFSGLLISIPVGSVAGWVTWLCHTQNAARAMAGKRSRLACAPGLRFIHFTDTALSRFV